MSASSGLAQSEFFRRLKSDLRRDQRKAKVLLGLLPLLGIAMIPIIAGGYPSKSKVKLAPSAALTAAEELPPVTVDHELREELSALVSRFEEARSSEWSGDDGVDAFAVPASKHSGPGSKLPGGADAVESPEGLEREAAEALAPSATFLSSEQGDLAIIGGNPYREGEQVEGFTLIDVDVRSIVLRGRFAEYPLRIPTGEEGRQ